jgi:hypothetical protein
MTLTGKTEVFRQKSVKIQCDRHKPFMGWPGIKPRPPRRDAGGQPP